MRQQFELRTIVGVLIWIALISGGYVYLRGSMTAQPATFELLAQYVGKQRHTVDLNIAAPQLLRVGDPVFLTDSDRYAPIGFVSSVADGDSKALYYTHRAKVTFYGAAPNFDDQAFLEYHRAPDTSEWVLKTMLHPAKRQEIGKLILDGYTQNQEKIVSLLRPVVEDTLRDASLIIREDLQEAFARREKRFRKIGAQYRSEFLEAEIIPLIQEEIWPIIQEESEPLTAQVGQEVWQEVSVFRFGWRYLYDRSPLPEKRLAEREFERFLDEKAIPILKSHVEEFLELQEKILRRVSNNPKVQMAFNEIANRVVTDPEVQAVLTEVFEEVFLENRKLKRSLEQNWKSPRARRALQAASSLLDPTIREIGVSLFGSPKEQITPEFAKVLRHRILHKDDRWLVLHVAGPTISDETRYAKPKSLDLRIASPVGEIPYAPAVERE
jgi:hypothetical protein